MRVRRLLGWILIFGLGLVFGPVLLALASGATASSTDEERWTAAYSLLKAYDERYPQISMPSMDLDSAVRRCGYDPETLFQADHRIPRDHWTPYGGYFDLVMWEHAEFREKVEEARTQHLAERRSPFSLRFLDQCLRATLMAPLCGRSVAQTLESGGLLSPNSSPTTRPRIDQARQGRTVCIYLDGIAARNGRPLAARAEEGGVRGDATRGHGPAAH